MKHLFSFLTISIISLNTAFAVDGSSYLSCNIKIRGNKVPNCSKDLKECIFEEFKNEKNPEYKLNLELNGIADNHINLKKVNLFPRISEETFDVTLFDNKSESFVSKNKNNVEITYLNSNRLEYWASGSEVSGDRISFWLKNNISFERAIEFVLPDDNNKEKFIILDENKLIAITCNINNERIFADRAGKEVKAQFTRVNGPSTASARKE